MVIIDNLLETSDAHGHTTDLVDSITVLLLVLVLWLEPFLVLDEFLLEQNVVLNSFLS